MNLLMISGERGIPEGRRGAFWNTLEVLRTHFDRIDVICPRTSSRHPNVQPFPNVTFHPSPWPLVFQPLWIKTEGTRLHREHGYGACTSHDYPPFYNGLGVRMLSRKTGLPYAVEFHHGEPVRLSLRGRIERWLLRLCVPWDVRLATRVRVVNAAAAATVAGWGVPKDKIVVVPSLYLDFDVFKPLPGVHKQYDFAFCSRLVDGKGLPELLEALVDVPAASLLVIGDGPRRARYERLVARMNLRRRVTFAGWLSTPQAVAEALNGAKVFVMNSWSEGNPRTAVEAMACGLPVIATKVGVMPELLGDGRGGMIVDSGKASLVDALRAHLEGLHPDVDALRKFERSSSIAQYANFLHSLRSS